MEYKGALHIHSKYSDGSGKLNDIIEDAKTAGLDFIVLTDHNTLQPRNLGWEGWHDSLLVIIGVELSLKYQQHFIAIGLEECDGYKYLDPPECLQKVKKQKAITFIAHPLGEYNPLFNLRMQGWKHWNQKSLTGFELWSYMYDWVEGLKPWRAYEYYVSPETKITGPNPKLLSMWDQFSQQRKMVAISALDAHARRVPFTWFKVFKYSHLFNTIRTHIQSEQLTGNAEKDIGILYRALQVGHCYIGYDLLADSTGFQFEGKSGFGRKIKMGDEMKFSTKTKLEVNSPQKALLRLIRNGKPVLLEESDYLIFHAEKPGVYRVEAYLDGKPWVFTNPIYLR